VSLFYFMYEFGSAFNTSMPLLQKTTYDTGIRTRITQIQRFWMVVCVLPVYFFVPIVTLVDRSVGSLGKSFSLVNAGIMLLAGVLAFIGVSFLKEQPETAGKAAGGAEKLNLREVATMFLHNRPLLIHGIGSLISNLVFALSSTVGVYFLKWYYAADLTTGAVDNVKYAGIYSLFAVAGLIPSVVSPFFSRMLIRKAKTYARATVACLGVRTLTFVVSTLLFFTGVLKASPFIYIIISFIGGMITGVSVVPGMLLWAESADYAEYRTGRKMSALVNSFNNILGKAQAALASVITGMVLIGAGYSVNEQGTQFMGKISDLPGMITWFGILLTVVPFFATLVPALMYRFLYPITPKVQQEMMEALAARRSSGAAGN